MHQDLLDELAQPPHLIIVRGRKHIQRLAQRAHQRGEVIRVLPGVFAPTGSEGLQLKAVALSSVRPDAVIRGRAAAALSWWPELEAPTMVATVRDKVAPCPGYAFQQGVVPPELVVESNQIRLTGPALTVLDLIPELGGAAIDEALRRRVVTLEALWEAMALTSNRAGNKERRWLLEDSRDKPWSPAERSLHRMYRGLELPWAYATNYPKKLITVNAFIDLALPELRLGFEVDGEGYHTDEEAFVRDRIRDPELVELGWVIVRFAAQTLDDRPDWMEARLRGISEGRAAELGLHR